MPPFCHEHDMYHSLIWGMDECDRMRAEARRDAKAAALHERAERIADNLIRNTWRELMPMRDQINMREIATTAALAALAEKEGTR